MKVTADAVLFGALTEVESARRVLDIGAGTGLLSLMAAQRTQAAIDAVELDSDAARQCHINFHNSPWSEQLSLSEGAIQTFIGKPYDTIICNPPFFDRSLKAPDHQRNMARHTDSLSFSDLAHSIKRLLAEEGRAWLILPVHESSLFIAEAGQKGLFPERIIALSSQEGKKAHRHILVLGAHKQEIKRESIALFSAPGSYSQESLQLLKAFYRFLE